MITELDVLQFLGCGPGKPGMRHLNRLISAYVRKVPWESAFRIARRAETSDPFQCPRWPEHFWDEAMHLGGGGTCFESNYAFLWLLQRLGYSGYLTVNDMGEQRGCHSAIIVHLNDEKILVDVGIPLLTALNVDPERTIRRYNWLHTYTVRPDGANCYQIERSRHPARNIYTLLDVPVPEAEYRKVVQQDYGEAGLFLNRVVLVKVIGGRQWRFYSNNRPYVLESFGRDGKQELPIDADRLPDILAEHFQMDKGRIATALRVVTRD